MRRNHSKQYKRNKNREDQFDIAYFSDPNRPDLWQRIDYYRRTIYYNTAASPTAHYIQRIGNWRRGA